MPEKYCVHLSLTTKCSHHCLHCSSSGNGKGKSVNFSELKKALACMQPYTLAIYISCEGDPFEYASQNKNIEDALKLIFDIGFKKVSFQSAVPANKKMQLFSDIINLLEIHPEISFFPQISFNLYYPDVFCSKNTSQYIKNFKRMVEEYAIRGYPLHFEIRYDNKYNITSKKNTLSLFNKSLSEVEAATQAKLKYTKSMSHIVPLGNAKKLLNFGNISFEEHVYSQKGRCPNWKHKMIIIDTKGFPLLCYSNLATTPTLKNDKGPNLYKGGFEKLLQFYKLFWEKRDISKKETYCPMPVFKKTLRSL